MGGNKVICGVCMKQVDGFCQAKKCKVALKKRRLCNKFVYDVNKVSIKIPLPSIKRSEFFWDRKERRRILKEMLAEAKKQMEKKNVTDVLPTINKDMAHPLTGDLSRFTTTVDKDEEKN